MSRYSRVPFRQHCVLGTRCAGESSWTLVEDELTGALDVTGNAGVHSRIAGVFERLESTDLPTTRELR